MPDVRTVVTEEWAVALDIEDPDLDGDFFASGGNSITAMAMARRIERRLGIVFPMEVLFVDSTLTAVVDACIRRSRETERAAVGDVGR